jgi:HEAT repeat protein
VDLAEVAARAAELTDERELSQLRATADDEIEAAARSEDFRARAVAFRAIGQMRFRAKTELLRRGLEDDSPACRGSALLSLELLSRDHAGVVNSVRSLLHQMANADANAAVRRLAVIALKNGSAHADTVVLLEHIASSDEEDRELRAAATKTVDVLKKKARAKK